jgi:signal transduction histidine kinase
MPRLRLSQQLAIAVGALVVVVGGLVGGTLVVVQQLAGAHRQLVEAGLPAVRLEVGLLEGLGALRRAEARYRVTGDPAFLRLFVERARTAGEDLERLEGLLASDAERRLAAESRTLLTAYRELVEGGGSPRAEEHPAPRLEDVLGRLYERSVAGLSERQARVEGLARRVRGLGGAAFLATLGIGAALAAFAVLRVARPLERLRTATQVVAAREFSQPIPVTGPNDIAELTQAFNRMAARLDQVDRTKEEFFTAVSHDLRTPLAAIRWSADLLQTGAPGPLTPKQARLLETIQSTSRRLLALVGQIVELSRLRAGRLRLERRPMDLRRLVAEAVDEMRPLAERADLRLDVRVPPDLPQIPADSERIYQVLINLLGNAVRFTTPGGQITVEASFREGEVVCGSRTPASASRRTSCPRSSSPTSRRTQVGAEAASDSRWCAPSWRRTADGCGWSHKRVAGAASPSRCRATRTRRGWRPNEHPDVPPRLGPAIGRLRGRARSGRDPRPGQRAADAGRQGPAAGRGLRGGRSTVRGGRPPDPTLATPGPGAGRPRADPGDPGVRGP